MRAHPRSPGSIEAMYGNGGHGALWTALYYLIVAVVAVFFLLAKTGHLPLPG